MPALQVRDFPAEQYELLKARAKANGRSISQEAKLIVLANLESDAAPEPVEEQPRMTVGERQRLERMERRKAVFERIASRPPYPPLPEGFDTVTLIREMRAER